eukprot:TRINITY_DN5546_c0_g1_i2.p1 TRINITY_DN5546_c0_g1~~TRINITY_DN5546_c0_g1_i2.p1  ORF type:complete len:224 (+),score=43.47 TRINITY_DN5546_c0_g1_i2:545-1216(+)
MELGLSNLNILFWRMDIMLFASTHIYGLLVKSSEVFGLGPHFVGMGLLFIFSMQMTNEVGKAIFSRAGALGVPVGFMCMKGLNLHLSEIIELCSEFPSTTVILDHVAFCKPPENDLESETFSSFLKLSRFPQVYVKFSALFRVSRKPFPYEDTSHLLSQVISSYGANRVMWGSDFPYVVPECSYKGAKEAVLHVASLASLSPSDLEWVMGKTVQQLFPNSWPA